MDMYDDYKDSGITWTDMVPSEWEVEPLWTRCDAIVPMRDKPTSFDGDIPWVKIEDFQGKYIYESKSGSNVSRQLADSMNKKSYPVGTVLCSCSCDLGKCAIVGAELYSNQTFIGLVADGENLISSYLYYLMQSSSTRLNYLASGSIQTYLSKRDFLHLKMVFPPLLEQEAISNYLDSKIGDIDSTINNVEKSITLLNEYRQSIVTEAVTHGLDSNAPMKPSGIEWMGNIPASWQARRVKAVVQRLNVGVVIEPSKYFDDNGTVPFLRGVNIKADGFDLSDLRYITTQSNALLKKSIVHTGDIVVVRDGAPGTALVIPPQLDGANCVSLLELTCASNIKPTYLRYALAANCSQAQFAFLSNGTAIKHLNASELGMILVTVPPLSEQDGIIAYLDAKTAEIDALIASKERQVELLREYRKSIISEAVTGKFKVPGLE